MADNISLDLFTARFDQLNEIHRELRADLRVMSETLIQLSRQLSNLDRRVSDVDQRVSGLDQRISGLDQRISNVDRRLTEVKDELEGTIKMEIGGAIAHLETRLEHYIDRRTTQPSGQFSED
jgi:chromosome segregation ATPase